MDSPHSVRFRPDQLRNAIRPVIQRLESRTLLSATLIDGTLAITGTDAADAIRIQPGKSLDRLRVTLNGGIYKFNFAEVQKISIDALGGDDDIDVLSIRKAMNMPVTVLGGEGDDHIGLSGGDDSVIGGDGDDFVVGNGGNDYIEGNAGNDTVDASAGDDTVLGGEGDDNLDGMEGTNTVDGGPGNNAINQMMHTRFPIQTFTGVPAGYSAQEIRNAYGFGDLGDPNYKNRGKGQAIVIVDAYHAPTARRDLVTFARTMNTLPGVKNLNRYFKRNFKQVFAEGTRPETNEGWNGEATLDIQWAHAIAPEAKIFLIEARSPVGADLDHAIDKGIDLLNKKFGGGAMSLSFGFQFEAPEQVAFDSLVSSEKAKNVSVIVASGDLGGVTTGYPSASPSVTSVGGTKLFLDPYGNRITGFRDIAPTVQVNYGLTPPPPLDDNWNSDTDCIDGIQDDTGIPMQTGISGGEGAWWNGSGGPSSIFDTPFYQQSRGIPNIGRGMPDVAWNGDPNTGVSVYSSSGAGGGSGWSTVGGTSAGAPQFAGLITLANQLRDAQHKGKLGNSLQGRIYRLGGTGPDAYFNDIDVHGSGLIDMNRACSGTGRDPTAFVFPATPGWDYATGWGSPNARTLIPALAQQKLKYTNRPIKFRGQISERVFQLAGTTGPPQGADAFQKAIFTGNTTIQGYHTMTMASFRMHHLDTTGTGFGGTGNGGGGGGTGGGGGQTTTTTVSVDMFGMDEQDGQPNPPAYDPITGLQTAPGSPIFLSRNGNVISGKAFYLISVGVTTQGGGGGGGTTNTTYFYFATQFRGMINNGHITGEFFAINADMNSTRVRGLFNAQGIPVVNGKFEG